MSTYSRKSFLALSAGAVLTQAPLARAATQFLEHADAALLPRPGRSGIEHVVVVMMENRSFDHLLGWLPGADGRQAGLDLHGQPGRGLKTPIRWRPTSRGAATPIPTTPTTAAGSSTTTAAATAGCARAATTSSPSATTPRPICRSSARRRRTGRCATAISPRSWRRPIPTASISTRRSPTGWTTRSRSRPCRRSGTAWATRGSTGATTSATRPSSRLWGTKYASITRPLRPVPRRLRRRQPARRSPSSTRRFDGEDAGTSSDDHPHGDIRAGESWLYQTYRAVTTSPDWKNTVLVINFDEWGGFFDHVPPPEAPDVDPGASTLRGFRVPCLVVSPFARPARRPRRLRSHLDPEDDRVALGPARRSPSATVTRTTSRRPSTSVTRTCACRGTRSRRWSRSPASRSARRGCGASRVRGPASCSGCRLLSQQRQAR